MMLKEFRNHPYRFFFYFALVVLVLSFIPRFYDTLKFLPHYHVDEDDIVQYPIGFYKGNFDHSFYSYGPFYYYILYVIYAIVSFFYEGGVEEFFQKVFFNNTPFYYMARVVNSLICIGLGLVMYKIARRIFSLEIAMFSLPFLMFPIVDQLFNFQPKPDMLLGLFALLSLLFFIRNFEKPSWQNYALCGLFLGLGVSAKPLPSILILPSVALGHLFLHIAQIERPKKRKKKKLVKSKQKKKVTVTKTSVSKKNYGSIVGAAILKAFKDYKIYLLLAVSVMTVVISFPYLIKNWDAFIKEQIFRIENQGAMLSSGTKGYRIDQFIIFFGYAFWVSSILGLGLILYNGIKKKQYAALTILSYFAVFFLVFSRDASRFYWYAPIIPIMVLAGGYFIHEFTVLGSSRFGFQKKQVAILIGLCLLVLAQPTYKLIARSASMNQGGHYSEIHTSLAAHEWIHNNIPAGEAIGLYGYYTNLPGLVDRDINEQASIGEYFWYGKGNNKDYVDLYVKAYSSYVANSENKTYDLINMLTVNNQDGSQAGSIHLRYRLKPEQESYLLPLLKQAGAKYLIAQYDVPDTEEWSSRLIKSFDPPEYPQGVPLKLYQL